MSGVYDLYTAKGCHSYSCLQTLLVWLCINCESPYIALPGFASIVRALALPPTLCISRENPCLAFSGLDEEGRSKRSAAAKKPRSKQLLCEQDPEAPGLTLEQRRKIRRHAPALCPHGENVPAYLCLVLDLREPDLRRGAMPCFGAGVLDAQTSLHRSLLHAI